MNRLIIILGLLLLGAGSTTSQPTNRMDDGRLLPIILKQYSAMDTTIVLTGPIPIDTVPLPTKANPAESGPVPKVMVGPTYPYALRQKGIEGMVWMKLLVTPAGDVAQVRILKTDHDGFNEAALRAAIQWKYTPVHDADSSVASWIALPMRFRLNK